MEGIGKSNKLTEINSLIQRLTQFHDLSPAEQKQALAEVLRWLQLDQQALAGQGSAEAQGQDATLKQILEWCQTDDYAYKDWK